MFEDAKNILANFAAQIPPSILGPERINFVITNISKLPSNMHLVLIQYFNSILQLMIDKEASDVEIGGYGCEGTVWFRIFGKKARVKELLTLTQDETNVLIVSILNQNQAFYLRNNRNLDFSYTFRYEKINRDVRFRADAYFDLDSVALNMRAISANVRRLKHWIFILWHYKQ
jgi:twitching motility protein PilT